MTNSVSKAYQRAQIPVKSRPEGPFPRPLPADCVHLYIYNEAAATELLRYCLTDTFLLAPTLKMLKGHTFWRLVKQRGCDREQLIAFAAMVSGFEYPETYAQSIYVVLSHICNFVTAASAAEELSTEQMRLDLEDKDFRIHEGIGELHVMSDDDLRQMRIILMGSD